MNPTHKKLVLYRPEDCERKTPFSNPETAEQAARDISLKTGRMFRAYQCLVCDRYHLSSKPDRKD